MKLHIYINFISEFLEIFTYSLINNIIRILHSLGIRNKFELSTFKPHTSERYSNIIVSIRINQFQFIKFSNSYSPF
jgi:hypothetical protein